MPKTVARLLADSLEAHDVDQVYCVPGESYIGLTSALIERNSIRVIICRHEGGGAGRGARTACRGPAAASSIAPELVNDLR